MSEIKHIDGFPGYTASSNGYIYGIKGNPLKERIQHGYVYVQMYNTDHKLISLSKHRIIAKLFVPNQIICQKSTIKIVIQIITGQII